MTRASLEYRFFNKGVPSPPRWAPVQVAVVGRGEGRGRAVRIVAGPLHITLRPNHAYALANALVDALEAHRADN